MHLYQQWGCINNLHFMSGLFLHNGVVALIVLGLFLQQKEQLVVEVLLQFSWEMHQQKEPPL